MAGNGNPFVEWKEEFVSQERGHRVVHYFLKDSAGESILAVVGTERSVRHMFYVVSEEFVRVYGAENAIHAGFKWRSRREVVDWLTSMLSKQQRQNDWSKSPKRDFSETSDGKNTDHPQKCVLRNFSRQNSDIVWSGASWSCGKQLKHYPAFYRNGTKIAIQSFVFVMAKAQNHYLAYLEDMYEDKRAQKKVKVRWFHHCQEVKGAVPLKNAHPKEVFITHYSQVISAECVDGPATVLKREHFNECAGTFPSSISSRVHLCFRQFRNNKIKPFDIAKLRGYYDQPILSYLNDKSPQEIDSLAENRDLSTKKFLRPKDFRVDEKIEILSQDSGIRGCWFRCTVVQVSQKQVKVQYDDVQDEDEYGNLEEWIPAFKLAASDKLGIRCAGRPTIRPVPPPCPESDTSFDVGAAVDAWWSDGWWEGVISRSMSTSDETYRIYFPGENFFLNVHKKDVRVSRDWVGGKWVDIKKKPEVLSEPLIPEGKAKTNDSQEEKREAAMTLEASIVSEVKEEVEVMMMTA